MVPLPVKNSFYFLNYRNPSKVYLSPEIFA